MGRAPCCDKMGLKRGPWTPQEDHILVDFIRRYGHGNWRALPKQAGLLRCGKSCRLRWINYLRPDIKRGNFSAEEEEAIINLHQHLGNRWSAIASRLPGRTDNEIKNVWNTHMKKKLLRMGIDPVTHVVTKHSGLHKTGDSLDYSEYNKEPCPSMEKDNLSNVSFDNSEYSRPANPLMEKDNLALCQAKTSFDYSEYSEATSPLMEEDNIAKALSVDSPTRVSNFPDLSSDTISSMSGLESEVISVDSSSLDWLQSNSVDSFDEPLGYIQESSAIEVEKFLFENQDFASEIGRFEVMCEQSSNGNAQYFMSANANDDILSRLDEEYTDTHLIQRIELQNKDGDDLDDASYWLNVLSQAGSSSVALFLANSEDYTPLTLPESENYTPLTPQMDVVILDDVDTLAMEIDDMWKGLYL